uniref:Large ribosomal subunit protein uL3 n=1 Tax=Desulfatirhabdium butyrativorans TaxID=340467 RepID=A0A7C4RTS1_9BACT
MSYGLIGRKLGMTGMFSPEGRYVPVTIVQAGPCVVTQIKTEATDGYNAIQVGFGVQKKQRLTKPILGHLKKAGDQAFAVLREIRVDHPENYTLGQVIGSDIFSIGDYVDVSGVSKGKGFAGVMRRHGFAGGRTTHGSQCHRIPGSIGASAWPSRVMKGKRLPGHYGNSRVTVRNLKVLDIRSDDNIILIKGAVPGSKTGILSVRKSKKQPKQKAEI